MGDIRGGTPISADDFPAAAQDEDGTDINNISQTTLTAGSPAVGCNFYAPTSGKVLLIVRVSMQHNSGTSTDRLQIAPAVYEGEDSTGTLIEDGGVAQRGARSEPIPTASGYHTLEGWFMQEGLTAGALHWAQLEYATTVTSTGLDISHRNIIVVPMV